MLVAMEGQEGNELGYGESSGSDHSRSGTTAPSRKFKLGDLKKFYWSQQGNPGMRNTRVPWVPAVPHSRLSHSKGSGGDCIKLLPKDVELEPWETSPGK